MPAPLWRGAGRFPQKSHTRHCHLAADMTGRLVQFIFDELEPVALIEGPTDFVVAEDLDGQGALRVTAWSTSAGP